MTQIIIDAALANKLRECHRPVELLDSAGLVVGQFVPRPETAQWTILGPEPTEEELDQVAQETESFSTKEVLAFLENLPCSESDGNGRH